MITIAAHQVTPDVLALFDLTKPTMPRAFNVLEGIIRGQILVDDPTHPAWGVVREVTYGTLYIGGQMNASLLASFVQHFRQLGDVGVGCWLNDRLNDMIPPNPDYDGRTLYFTNRSPFINPLEYQLPTGYTLIRRDQRLLKQSFDYETTVNAFTTEENVLQYTLGFVVLHNGRIVCEAATGAPTHGRIEVGVTTAESYRQRGFATLACARLIEACRAHGYTTWWDCAKQNIPSIQLARKLGYRNEKEYRYVWWARN